MTPTEGCVSSAASATFWLGIVGIISAAILGILGNPFIAIMGFGNGLFLVCLGGIVNLIVRSSLKK